MYIFAVHFLLVKFEKDSKKKLHISSLNTMILQCHVLQQEAIDINMYMYICTCI